MTTYVFNCGCERDEFTIMGRGTNKFRGCPEHGDSVKEIYVTCVDCGSTFMRLPSSHRETQKDYRCEKCHNKYIAWRNYCWQCKSGRLNRPEPTLEHYMSNIYKPRGKKTAIIPQPPEPADVYFEQSRKIKEIIMAGIPWDTPKTPRLDALIRI